MSGLLVSPVDNKATSTLQAVSVISLRTYIIHTHASSMCINRSVALVAWAVAEEVWLTCAKYVATGFRQDCTLHS